jgi:hypothetical protein
MFSNMSKKNKLVTLGVIGVLATAGVAIAYFTSTGSGTGSATVGSSTPLSVTFGTVTGTMYPGSGTSTLPYTITNPSAGHQNLAATTATVVNDGAGNIKDAGIAVPGCLATWFTATNSSPAAVDLAGGASTTGSVAVTMANAAANQDPCQGHHPDITVNAS